MSKSPPSPAKIPPLLAWFGRLVVMVAGIAACWGVWYVVYQDSLAKSQTEEGGPKGSLLTVQVVPVHEDKIEERITLVGSLFPTAQTEIRSRVDGYIKKLPLDVGDPIKLGDTICWLDDADQREAVSRAEATLKVAKAQLRAQMTEVELANKNVERQRALSESGAATQQLLDSADAALKIANAGVELEEARVSEAEATLLRARLALEDLRIIAPISGFVAERMLDVGDLAKPDTPILRIVNINTVKTTVNVVEKNYRKIQVGQRAEVRVDAYPTDVFDGVVTRVSPVLDPETRTGAVYIDVANSELRLKPGMYARVAVRSKRTKPGILVPIAAVLENGARSMVYVVDRETSRVQAKEVQVGLVKGEIAEILSGLSPDDEVITLGNRLVKLGQEVNVERVDMLASLREAGIEKEANESQPNSETTATNSAGAAAELSAD